MKLNKPDKNKEETNCPGYGYYMTHPYIHAGIFDVCVCNHKHIHKHMQANLHIVLDIILCPCVTYVCAYTLPIHKKSMYVYYKEIAKLYTERKKEKHHT